MPEERKPPWISWLALSTAVMAVLAAITTLYMGKFSSRTLLAQAQESDQWAFYQAKSLKSHLYAIEKRRLELDLEERGASLAKAARDSRKAALAEYADGLDKYEGDKQAIKAKADTLAADKELAQRRGGNFGYSLLFLQIAIMLSSVAAIVKQKPLWLTALALCLGWAYFFLNGWLLFR